jgi:hypothetical protein
VPLGFRGAVAARALVAAIAVILAGLVAGLNVRFAQPATGFPSPPRSGSDAASELHEQLSKCRSYSAVDPTEPDWKKAELACNRALDLEPISEEANRMLKQVKQEQTAFDLLHRAESARQALDELGALELLARIPETSVYFQQARPLALEIKSLAMKRLEPECKKLLRSHAWMSALVTCEKYVALACQPGPDRRPDPLYSLFLRARGKAVPGAAPWRCPESKLLRESEEASDVRTRVREALLQRFSDERIGEALFRYWEGNSRSAIAALQKVSADPKARALHSRANALRSRIWLVSQLQRSVTNSLQARDPERAEKALRSALQHDGEILGELEQAPSFVARTIQREMGAQSYQRGRYWADRSDLRRACRIWKLGHQFSRGNLALLQALKHCSERAEQLLAAAGQCGELAIAAELSTEGDGLLNKLQAKQQSLGCP